MLAKIDVGRQSRGVQEPGNFICGRTLRITLRWVGNGASAFDNMAETKDSIQAQYFAATSAKDHGYISIDRTFHELPITRHRATTSISRRRFIPGVIWRATMYCGARAPSSGSGKTAEIRPAAARLRAKNKAAFFVGLELIADDFDIDSTLERWMNSMPGWHQWNVGG